MQRQPKPEDMPVDRLKHELRKTANLLREELKQFQVHRQFTEEWNADKEWQARAIVMHNWFTFAISRTTEMPVPHARFKRLRDVTSSLVRELEQRSE